MSKVIIVVNAQVEEGKVSATAPVTERMAIALSQSIIDSQGNHEVKIIGGADLWTKSQLVDDYDKDLIYCPLTIKLPDWFDFLGKDVYMACRDLEGRRKWVKDSFGYQVSNDNTSLGDLWLPIMVKDDRQMSYGTIIGEGMIPNHYQQPYHLASEIINSLQELAEELLISINAIPSVYLLQFKLIRQKVIFDRLWPFPATPAIASVNNTHDNLYSQHWSCISSTAKKKENLENSLKLPS